MKKSYYVKKTANFFLNPIVLLAGMSFYVHAYDDSSVKSKHAVDLVVFSYDRPMQLYALLESIEQHVCGLGAVYVIYRTSNQQYEKAYQEVLNRFFHVTAYKQSDKSERDFKYFTQKAVFATTNKYIMFAVDDMMVKSGINVGHCAQLLEQTGAFGFYLRLGMNTTFCYPTNTEQGLPRHMQNIAQDVFAWCFCDGRGDWAYPHSVDMTIWLKNSIADKIQHSSYTSPTRLEEALGSLRGAIMGKQGLCYVQSKVINIPLNMVQKIYNNRCMNSYGAAELLTLFEQGLKIDIGSLYNYRNRSAHMDWNVTFIERL
jgi:hypothetical protein